MTKRKVAISEEPRHRPRSHQSDSTDLGIVAPVKLKIPQSIPTGDHRHCTSVREGTISFEIFGKSQLARIPVDKDVDLAGEREIHRASKKLQERRSESVSGDDKAVRKEEGSSGVLRDGKQTRKRKEPDSESKQRIQKAKARKKPSKKVTKRG